MLIRIDFSQVDMGNKMPRSPARTELNRASRSIEILPVTGVPEIHPGDDLAGEIVAAARRSRVRFEDRDILVVAQKIVSKAEGRLTRLADVIPSTPALELAGKLKKDPRLIEMILRKSRRIVRSDPVLIVETHHGLVCANAGVDQSNIPGDEVVSLLPRDPDGAAGKLAAALRKLLHKRIAVIISDTFGRPWRLGLTNVAIGAAGVPALVDLRGTRDLHGKLLHATILAVADEVAAPPGLRMAKSEGIPAVIIGGYRYRPVLDPAARIIRAANEDLFR